MVTKVVMPKFSETMKEGTIVEWLKKEGEGVRKGEPIVEILGEKLTYELEAPASGTLLRVLIPEENVVPVLQTIAFIGEPGEELPEFEAPAEEVKEEMIELAPPAETKVEKVERRVRSSPAAKKLAREHGIDLTQMEGTGPGGRILEEDVRRFIEERRERRVRETIPLVGIRKVAAERVLHSARTAPHVTLMMEVDMSETVRLRQELMKNTDIHISYTDILVKAVAKGLEEHPILNSTMENEEIKLFDDINIGVAVSVERGLMVPVVHNANKKSLVEIASTLKGLIEKARQGNLSQADLTGSTFTITNLGMFGVDVFTPIINPPECAILGVGRLTERPVAADGKIELRPTMHLCLSFDHRIVDGVPAAQFLQRLREILENPIRLQTST